MRILLYFSFFLSFSVLHAQEQVFNIPVSPNAASLGKYGQIPVNTFTGVPNITIPIYTIEEENIVVPISISYHASGHKPGETASWVGLGWTLNAGGAIVRNLNGTPDENGYFKNINEFVSIDKQQKLYLLKTELNKNDSNYLFDYTVKEKMWKTINYEQGTLAADLFYYNFPGGTGKFQFEPNQKIISFPYSHLLFEPSMNISDYTSGGGIFSFKIKSPEGLEFGFGAAEETYSENLTTGQRLTEVYNSAWYLTTIHSKISNKNVQFSYGSIEPISKIPIAQESVTSIFSDYSPQHSWTESSTITNISQRNLERISWSKGVIEFYRSNRLDVIGARKLDSIAVLNNQGDLIKKYKFQYSYFNSNEYLRLDEMIEVGKNGSPLPSHKFDYYPNIPDKETKAIDHYGFYNGRLSNVKTLPYYYSFITGPKIPLADREIHENMPIAGMLKSIDYPTGGYSGFEYESNTSFGSIEKNIRNSAVAEYCDDGGVLYIDPLSGQTVQGLTCNPIAVHQIDSLPQYISIKIRMHLKAGEGTQVSPGDAIVRILEENNGTYDQVFYYNLPNTDLNTVELTHLIPGKRYKMSLVNNLMNTALHSNLDYTIKSSQNSLAPGIRIKKITTKPYRDSNIVDETKYGYTKNNTSESSGIFRLYEEPRYHYSFSSGILASGDISGSTITTIIVQDSPRNLSSFEGPTVYYSEVTTYQPNNGFKKDFYGIYPSLYEHSPEELPDGYQPESHQWKRGMKLREAYYKDTDSVLLYEKKYDYSFHDVDTSITFVSQVQDDRDNQEVEWDIYSYAWNRQISGWARLDSTVEINYEEDNIHQKWTKNEYGYGAKLMLPTKVSYLGNSNLFKENNYEYLNDTANYVLNPLKSTKVVGTNNNFISHNTIEYQSFKPISTYKLDVLGNMYHKNNYTYELDGKLKTIRKYTGDISEIHWGYQNTEPIVVVRNGTVNPRNAAFLPGGYENLDSLLNNVRGIVNDINQQNTWSEFVENVLNTCKCSATFFTHKPLVGITSITDENGVSSYYHYDEFNRLKYIKDDEGNIKKSYSYHYHSN
jgi:hypothetical protein